MIRKGKVSKKHTLYIECEKKGIALKNVKFGERKTFDKLLLN
jgi:hypothetical protein